MRLLFCRGLAAAFWLEYQSVSSVHFDLLASEQQREVPAFCPERQQVAIVRALGLARLSRHIDRNRVVPITEIEYFPERCAAALNESRACRGVDCVPVASA